ncbi:Uncharacterised protein [Achromobacter kerstersii]|nr:Uncharacterised protein [Achromobacter kerstersii]
MKSQRKLIGVLALAASIGVLAGCVASRGKCGSGAGGVRSVSGQVQRMHG